MLFRSRSIAVVLILLTFSGAAGSWHATDDYDGETGLLLHDHSAHHERLRTPAAPATASHCALCHWLRTFGTGAPLDAPVTASEAPRLVRQATVISQVRTTNRIALPPRAPPLA